MESPDHVRGAILYILKLYLERERIPDEGDGYMLAVNLQAHLAQYYRIHLSEGQLTGYLTTLKDAGYAQYKEQKVGVPPHGHLELTWRITGDGMLLLSGERDDAIVAVPRWLRS
jgi:hypothetical protein